jgi:cullin 4
MVRRALAYELFADRIFHYKPLVKRIQEGIEEWIQWERKEEAEHELRGFISKLINHLKHHNQYKEIFEEFYLDGTRHFYLEESKSLRDSGSASQFLARCEERDIQEQNRAKTMLLPESWDILKDTARRAQLIDRLEWICKEGMLFHYEISVYIRPDLLIAIPPLMDAKNSDGMRKMYVMFSAVDGLKVMQNAFKLQVEVRLCLASIS